MLYIKQLLSTLIAILSAAASLSAQNKAAIKSNKMIVIEMNRLFNEGKTDSAMVFFGKGLRSPGKPGSPGPFTMMQEDIDRTFPDVQTIIKDIWEDGEWVITRCLFTGTHKGTARLPHHGGLFVGVPPTNKKFSVQHIRIYKVVDGKVVDRQAVRDDIGMYQQLGLLPSPAPPFAPPANSRPSKNL